MRLIAINVSLLLVLVSTYALRFPTPSADDVFDFVREPSFLAFPAFLLEDNLELKKKEKYLIYMAAIRGVFHRGLFYLSGTSKALDPETNG